MARKRKSTQGELPELTPLENQLMRVIWEQGNATAAEIGETLKDDRPLAATTIHTVLSNLRKKGYIEPVPTVERSLRFAPRVAAEQVAGRSLRRLMGEFFGGSPQRLMAHLIQEEKPDAAELEKIRKILNQHGSRPSKEKGGRKK